MKTNANRRDFLSQPVYTGSGQAFTGDLNSAVFINHPADPTIMDLAT